MSRSAKAFQRNTEEREEILNGPSFLRAHRFRHCVSKSTVGFGVDGADDRTFLRGGFGP